jgi:Histidine kinase
MPPALPPRNTSAPTGQLDRTDNRIDARASPGREPEPWRRRRQLERQLHDGASLRISALALRLGLLRGQAPVDEVTWRDTIAEVQDQLHAVLQELREVERQLYPPALDEAGLGPALRELADRYGTRLELDIEGSRFGRQVEGAAYFAVADWLDCRGPGRPETRVAVRREQPDLVLALSPFQAQQLAWVRLHTVEVGGRETWENGTLWVRIPCG